MMILLIALLSFFISLLTLFSGFGLGTLLMPAFALFFPIEVAVAATAMVHGANNILKTIWFGRHADRELIVRFGGPAVLAAFAGAGFLGWLASGKPMLLKPFMASLILVFALMELVPKFRNLRFDRKYLAVGGLLSGFFGGLSGHQGALRAAFLTKAGIEPQAFVGTNAIIGLIVDLARLSIYGLLFLYGHRAFAIGADAWPVIGVGIVAAFAGMVIGGQLIHKVTMHAIQTITGLLLFGISIAMGLGVI